MIRKWRDFAAYWRSVSTIFRLAVTTCWICEPPRLARMCVAVELYASSFQLMPVHSDRFRLSIMFQKLISVKAYIKKLIGAVLLLSWTTWRFDTAVPQYKQIMFVKWIVGKAFVIQLAVARRVELPIYFGDSVYLLFQQIHTPTRTHCA